MKLDRKGLHRAGIAGALIVGVAALVAVTAQPAWTDDRDLLTKNTTKPYLWILLDTSGSMNLKIGATDEAAVGFGDDPDSRIYAAKEALFRVFSDVRNVHFGFATFNQDRLHVPAKHYLYFRPPSEAMPDGWPFNWPDPDDDLTKIFDQDGDGIDDIVNDIDGDALVFGATMTDRFLGGAGSPLPAGDCTAPLSLKYERERINSFARLGANGLATTTMWIRSAGATWMVEFLRGYLEPGDPDPGLPGPNIGEDFLPVLFIANRVTSCSPLTFDDTKQSSGTVMMRLDPNLGGFVMVDEQVPDEGAGPKGPPAEGAPGYWPWTDAPVQTLDLSAGAPGVWVDGSQCGATKPFTGRGWEGNYDSGAVTGNSTFDAAVTDHDPFCTDWDTNDQCIELKPMAETKISPRGRYLDSGDMIPFDWDDENKFEFLRRLAPNWPLEEPNFGVAYHLADATVGGLPPRLGSRPPIVATGVSPIGKSLLDQRCWYLGKNAQGNNKCDTIQDSPFYEDEGWSEAACRLDLEFGCRRPFVVIISDGADTCEGEAPVADISDLKTRTGLKTWALNLGNPQNCQAAGDAVLKSVTTAGDGSCINIADKAELRTALEGILGTIATTARSFASAAVPTVQSDAALTIFLSSFRALPDTGFWDGHLNNFFKPIPVDADGLPDVADKTGVKPPCQFPLPPPPTTEDFGCHLWDAATSLLGQGNDPDPLDLDQDNRRRVFYSRMTTQGNWPNARRLLDPTPVPDPVVGLPAAQEPVPYDLWRGLQLITASTADGSLSPANEAALTNSANSVIATTLSIKSGNLSDGTPIPGYLLGDIFHSRPVIVDAPPNNFYFAQDLGSEFNGAVVPCAAQLDASAANADRGYRCFLDRQSFRRKVLLVGANDGMLHAFDVGQYDRATQKFTAGTGKEIWAYMPRQVMPAVRDVARGGSHRFMVDGTPSVADVFIDPVFAPAAGPQAGDRRWRTVAVTGLREGGSGYFALDVTEPDPLAYVNLNDPTFAACPAPPAPAPVGSDCRLVPLPNSAGTISAALAGCRAGGGTCGPVSYPAALWEFGDSTADSRIALPPAVPVPLDEDANGAPDLGDTWSNADIGRIRICAGAACNPALPVNDLRDVYVAVFGGGADPAHKEYDPRHDDDPGVRGNWLYMVDVETGKVLYKRKLDHSAAASPAAVDTDQDGVLDRIYIGTLGGSLYRVDLVPDGNGNLPALTTVSGGARDLTGVDYDVERIVEDSNGNPVWEPVKIFDANFNGSTPTTAPRPLPQPPSVFFVTELGLYGVAFGSGDREDLWAEQVEGATGLQQARFYLFVDETGLSTPPPLPMKESNFVEITLGVFTPAAPNYLTTRGLGGKGWFIPLDPRERVISQAFSLSGLSFFSSFQPEVDVCPPGQDPPCPDVVPSCGKKDVDDDFRCTKSGTSRVFLTDTRNADPFFRNDKGEPSRYLEVAGALVSDPFTEIGYGGAGDDGGSGATTDDLTADEEAVMEAIKQLFPANCRFTNQRVDVKLVTSKTLVRRIAAVPVCVIEKNWKEF